MRAEPAVAWHIIAVIVDGSSLFLFWNLACEIARDIADKADKPVFDNEMCAPVIVDRVYVVTCLGNKRLDLGDYQLSLLSDVQSQVKSRCFDTKF